MLVRVPQLEPSLQLALIDADWLEKYLDDHPESLAHRKEHERPILTAETSELQKFAPAAPRPG